MTLKNEIIYGPVIGTLKSNLLIFTAQDDEEHSHLNKNHHKTISDILEERRKLQAQKQEKQENEELIDIQFSVHVPGRALKRELSLVFPDKRQDIEHLKVIPIFLKSSVNLVAVTPESNQERDEKLETVLSFAHQFYLQMKTHKYWADITDPASGYPIYTAGAMTLYPDVDGSVALLKYHTDQAGCCRVITHPQWGTHNYPATLFTDAPLEVIEKAMNNLIEHPS